MRIRLYNDITARLARVRMVDGIPAYVSIERATEATETPNMQVIKSFDLWNENVVHLTQQRPFQTPAVFIEFLPIVWQQVGRKAKRATVGVRLHVVTATLATMNSPYKESVLFPLYLIRAIDTAMRGMAGVADERGLSYNTFVHAESATDHNHEQVSEHIETWQTKCHDCSAVLQDDHIQTPNDVTLDDGRVFSPCYNEKFA